MNLEAAVDALLGPHARRAGPAVRAAILARMDDSGRFYDWSSPEDPHFAWAGWFFRAVAHNAAECLGQTMVEQLKLAGFWIGRDRDRLGSSFRHGAKGRLRVRLSWFASSCEAQFYVDHNLEHPAGPRYAFHPEQAASYLDRKLFELIRTKVSRTLVFFGYRDRSVGDFSDPVQAILWDQLRSGHWQRGVGLLPTQGYRHCTQDGVPLVEGMRVQFFGRGGGGGLREGVAFCSLNNMWHVASGDQRFHLPDFELLSWQPGRPRRLMPLRVRLSCVSKALADAVVAEDFQRAHVLKRVRNRLRQELPTPGGES